MAIENFHALSGISWNHGMIPNGNIRMKNKTYNGQKFYHSRKNGA